MLIYRLYPLETAAAFENNMEQVDRGNTGSLSESDHDSRKIAAMDNKKDGEYKKKHRRGRKRNRPKWKPYAKMSDVERKEWDLYEQSRMEQKEKKLAMMSSRPVAPFNTTQFLMEDRKDSEVYKPHLSELNRCVSFDSSTSGVVEGYCENMANSILSFSPPNSVISSPPPSQSLFSPLSHSLLFLGEDSFEIEDESFVEQEAFLEADFNQVYNQLRMDRLEVMNKQDLIQECFSLEDRLASMEQQKHELLKEVQELREQNKRCTDEISTTTLPISS